jgi:hypothetical protein
MIDLGLIIRYVLFPFPAVSSEHGMLSIIFPKLSNDIYQELIV